MTSRREFLKQAGVLTGASGLFLSESIRRAFAIDPMPNTTWRDAEHVVILMQENRSFDHVFGTLRGVRGFDDPRAIVLPNGNPVWLQSTKAGETFSPFRFDIKNTKITWLGSLPHGWADQTEARNAGKHDGWLDAKKSGHKECADMPLTLGAYTRFDIPFYYEFADAFTICDQHFCSSLTGTMPNRLFLWSGTNRGSQDASNPARVNNDEIEYEDSCHWKTFPDRLEDMGISWKVYQNEINAVDVGLHEEAAAWLANYGDNPLEWFPQFHVGFFPTHQARLAELIRTLPGEIEKMQKALEVHPASEELRDRLKQAKATLSNAEHRRAQFSPERFEQLPVREKNLHAKGLSTNVLDPHYRELTSLRYIEEGSERTIHIPKGDVLHEFRQNVLDGKLPAVSWIVAPENFSDHPSSAWYGAWYVSEVLNILTQNPEVWRKTILLLTYDENDGYYDHIPPFVAPHPSQPETGMTAGVKTEADFITVEEKIKSKRSHGPSESSIGLGFRVPLVIASPWSRGGYVCSQVFDHTSPIQFLEKLLTHRLGKAVHESNISEWRRTVCGDLTSSFRPYENQTIPLPDFLQKEPLVEGIHKAKFKPMPTGFKSLSDAEIQEIKEKPSARKWKLQQEPGIRPACALPYELIVDGMINSETGRFEISFAVEKKRFGQSAAGAAFNVYAPGRHKVLGNSGAWERCRNWNFAIPAGKALKYEWYPAHFEAEQVHLHVHGPNGFFREFRSDSRPPITVRCKYQNDFDLVVALSNNDPLIAQSLEISDNSYGRPAQSLKLVGGEQRSLLFTLKDSSGWYDFTVRSAENSTFMARLAGHFENGKESSSDPVIGRSSQRAISANSMSNSVRTS